MTKRKEIMEQMLPQMNRIVYAWNNYGIIIESQFDFADHQNIRQYCEEIYEILIDYGGTYITSLDYKNDIHAFVVGDYVPIEGTMYCLFNPDVLTLSEAKKAIQGYFKRKYI